MLNKTNKLVIEKLDFHSFKKVKQEPNGHREFDK